jgi:hypothetical protein
VVPCGGGGGGVGASAALGVRLCTTGPFVGGGGGGDTTEFSARGAEDKGAMGASSLSRDTVDLNVGCGVVVVTIRIEGADVRSESTFRSSSGATVGTILDVETYALLGLGGARVVVVVLDAAGTVVVAVAAVADGLVRTMVVTKALAAMINTTTMPRQM